MNLLGVDIGGSATKVVLEDSTGTVIRRIEIETRAAEGPDALAQRLVEAVSGWEFDGAGLSVAGLLDLEGELRQAPNLSPFVGADLRAAFAGLRPAVVENDVNCAVWGEFTCGSGQGVRHLAMFSLGTGVGGGLILDGRLWRGSGGLGAELGHMVLDPEGPECPCGLKGHVESWLGARGFAGVARRHAAAGGESRLAAAIRDGADPDARLLATLAGEGCAVAAGALAECGRWLGIACANVVAVLQPDRILLAGGSMRAGHFLFDPALAEYQRRCMDAARGTVELRVAELGVESAAIGAARLARASLDADRPATR